LTPLESLSVSSSIRVVQNSKAYEPTFGELLPARFEVTSQIRMK
jgi:hypothetical protein